MKKTKIFDCITFNDENLLTNTRFEILNKYVDGKINSFYKDNVLLEQVFCNPDFYEGTVGDMVNEFSGRLGEKIYIKRFSRLEIGS